MRKLLFSSIFLVLSLVLVMVMRAFMPKYSGMLLFFFFFLLFDGYLWSSVHRGIKKNDRRLRRLAAILFWLPVIFVLCFMVCSFFIPFLDWNLPVRTYIQSLILILFLAEFLPLVALILTDFFRLGTFAFLLLIPEKRKTFHSIPRFRPMLIAGWMLGGLIFTILLAGMVFWQFDFRVRRQEIMLNSLPPAFDGFKIVQFSDVHLGSWGSKQQLQRAIDKINGLHPDVIFFTGDMFNYRTADGDGFEDILRTLRAPYGIYAIMGNHDYGDYITWPSAAAKAQNLADLKTYYRDLGWKLLLNMHDILKKGNDSVAVIGVENWGATRRFQRRGNIAAAQRGTESMAIQLLLSHDPSHWDSIISKKYPRIDITFSGHTHGGQVGIDFRGVHWSPVKWVSRFWCGLYKNPAPGIDQYLYVNQGLGNIGYAGRVGIMPEITMIILKAKRK